jgi:triosephosphate isomerase (TIM)
MRPKIIAGNWKMNGSQVQVKQLLDSLKAGIQKAQPTNSHSSVEMIVFPPFVYLEQAANYLKGSSIKWGAQNVSGEMNGAFTGEISAAMLHDIKCEYVIIGHSERRILYHENDKIVAKKLKSANENGLKPILCIGETLEQFHSGQTQHAIGQQLGAIIATPEGTLLLQNAMIAYEPVWAIGTGLTATPEQAQHVHQTIRYQLEKEDAALAARIPLLYGGSVKAANAASLMKMPDIDGVLVGGASLDAKEFLAIYEAGIKVSHDLCPKSS